MPCRAGVAPFRITARMPPWTADAVIRRRRLAAVEQPLVDHPVGLRIQTRTSARCPATREPAWASPKVPATLVAQQLDEPLEWDATPRSLGQDERHASLDPGERVGQRAEIRCRRRSVDGLGVVRADRVEGAVLDAFPQRLDIGAERSGGTVRNRRPSGVS